MAREETAPDGKGIWHMGITDIFRSGEYKARCEELEREVERLRGAMTPEMAEAASAQKRIDDLLEGEKKVAARISELHGNVESLKALEARYLEKIEERKGQVESFDDAILVQDYGLYEPRFDFATSTQFKDELKRCRDEQKAEVKQMREEAAKTNWTVNNNKAQGKKMVRDISKLVMRAYNSECDDIVRKVKGTNVEKSIERVHKLADQLNRLCKVLSIRIPDYYPHLKEREVRLAYEFALQKEREREEIRAAREREREERKLAAEIAAERKKLEKEKMQYLAAYKEIAERLLAAGTEERDDLERRAEELKGRLEDAEAAIQNVDYREANQKAGFVYVISNIGSFGEGVYKIGMTRRLDPMDRVRELGDASVPFNFDVHAMIFCDDAPALEAALHRRFEDRKVNIVNQRREFFRVTLDEIEQVVKENYDKTVEFKEVADADQFRTSEALRQQGIFVSR